jgi:dTDP-glucose 4,6-dehydratase
MRLLVTGGAGFVGHHICEHFLRNTDYELVVIDRLTYASTWDRLRDVQAFDEKRVTCLAADFTQPLVGGLEEEIGKIDVVLHLGAETHVDNSISNPLSFIQANVIGTHWILDFCRRQGAHLMYFGTDEVFGPAPDGVAYKEDDRHAPGNPYAATKSGGEMLVMSYGNTYQIPYTITRCMNIFGERQHPEKFIPLVLRKVLNGETVTIHSNASRDRAGSRFYIHARNVAAAYLHLLENRVKQGETGEAYHIVGEREIDNLTLAQMIADIVGKPLHYEMVDFHSSRPGHDLRYALDGSKLARAGWTPPMAVEVSLERTVKWFMANPRWLGTA